MRLIPIILVGVVLVSCSSGKPLTPEAYYQYEKNKIVKKSVENIPEWFSEPHKEDKDAVYSVGTAIGPNLQLTYDRAVLNAKRVLADRVDGVMSSKVKQFIAESGQNEDKVFVTEAERVVTNFMAEVNVGGYSVKKTDIQSSWGRYRIFVMLKYPVGRANDILMSKLNTNTQISNKHRAKKAFRELENDLDLYRQKQEATTNVAE